MDRKSRTARKRGRPVEVRFFVEEDRLIRTLAVNDLNRSVADTVRLLALAEAKRRAARAA
jgi:hypothetical protein